MAKRRKKRPSGTGQPKTKSARPPGTRGHIALPKAAEGTGHIALPKAAQTVAFTDLELAFFAAGDTMAERVAAKIARMRDEGEIAEPRPSFWRRLFARSPITA